MLPFRKRKIVGESDLEWWDRLTPAEKLEVCKPTPEKAEAWSYISKQMGPPETWPADTTKIRELVEKHLRDWLAFKNGE